MNGKYLTQTIQHCFFFSQNVDYLIPKAYEFSLMLMNVFYCCY